MNTAERLIAAAHKFEETFNEIQALVEVADEENVDAELEEMYNEHFDSVNEIINNAIVYAVTLGDDDNPVDPEEVLGNLGRILSRCDIE